MGEEGILGNDELEEVVDSGLLPNSGVADRSNPVPKSVPKAFSHSNSPLASSLLRCSYASSMDGRRIEKRDILKGIAVWDAKATHDSLCYIHKPCVNCSFMRRSSECLMFFLTQWGKLTLDIS
jgi:hypothetical protein